MEKEKIQRHYAIISSQIENEYAGRHVPTDIQHYYLLAELIALSEFRKFSERYGWQPIDQDFASIGKEEMLGLGPLSIFEKEVCGYWENEVARYERAAQRPQLPIIKTYS